MRNYLKIGFMAIAILVLTASVSVTETRAQSSIINEILKRMDEHYKALASLKSNVTMDKYNSQLDEHDVSEGTVVYLPAKGRDATVRIDWVKPQQEILVVLNKTYVDYKPSIKQAITGKVSDVQKGGNTGGMLDFMSMSKDQLRENYAIRYMGEENVSGSISTWHLELTPKAAKSYKSADIWVDKDGMPIQTRMNEKNNDSSTILLSGLRKNETINGGVFKLSLPPDVKIIKN